MRKPNTVELLSISGGDWTHARAAWASTNTEIGAVSGDRVPALLRMLAENGHGTPFEHSLLSFRIQSDIASHIHWLKHRAGVSINSESARYKELKRDDFYLPEDWPKEATTEAERIVETLQAAYHQMIEGLIASGLSRKRAKESARFLLPYANQIRYVATFNFRSFVHFQKLRNAEDAQLEIREIAQQMLERVREYESFKYSLEAFGLLE